MAPTLLLQLNQEQPLAACPVSLLGQAPLGDQCIHGGATRGRVPTPPICRIAAPGCPGHTGMAKHCRKACLLSSRRGKRRLPIGHRTIRPPQLLLHAVWAWLSCCFCCCCCPRRRRLLRCCCRHHISAHGPTHGATTSHHPDSCSKGQAGVEGVRHRDSLHTHAQPRPPPPQMSLTPKAQGSARGHSSSLLP
jgi:hypothetical protein